MEHVNWKKNKQTYIITMGWNPFQQEVPCQILVLYLPFKYAEIAIPVFSTSQKHCNVSNFHQQELGVYWPQNMKGFHINRDYINVDLFCRLISRSKRKTNNMIGFRRLCRFGVTKKAMLKLHIRLPSPLLPLSLTSKIRWFESMLLANPLILLWILVNTSSSVSDPNTKQNSEWIDLRDYLKRKKTCFYLKLVGFSCRFSLKALFRNLRCFPFGAHPVTSLIYLHISTVHPGLPCPKWVAPCQLWRFAIPC